ncbi:hypothetical protein ACIP86_12170 [Pseudomonas neuropathica]
MSILKESKTCPVFVHSLFRAGSTYIFSVFRSSSAGYWCYQEPMSEFVLSARNERESMLAADENLAKVLRHPNMKEAYYSELYSVSDECITKLEESCIYDGYFATTPEQAGVPYFSGLISSAKGRPLIQECRTSSRIGVIKSALGGCHIYLWRNPWDQWWSYKVDHYFDDANQICINGADHPDVISRLIDEVGFNGLTEGNIFQKFSWFYQNRLSPENSYLVFYVLWFLGLKEGLESSDLRINIDRLSDSLEYRNYITHALGEMGVDGLDFSECSVPQAVYGAKDRAFFEGIEQRAHGLLLLSGTSQTLIDEVVALRKASEPLVWHRDYSADSGANLVRDAERARELVLCFEKRVVDARIEHERHLLVEHERYSSIEASLLAESAQVKMLDAKCLEFVDILDAADARTSVANAERQKVEDKLASREAELQCAHLESKAMAAELERQIQELMTSASWRLTRPLRVLNKLIKDRGINLKTSPLLKIKHQLKSFISRLMRKAVANPRIKGLAVGFLSRRPVLKARLKRIAWGMQQSRVSVVGPSSPALEPSTSYAQLSSFKKKGNGEELKSPLESFFY